MASGVINEHIKVGNITGTTSGNGNFELPNSSGIFIISARALSADGDVVTSYYTNYQGGKWSFHVTDYKGVLRANYQLSIEYLYI